MTTKESFQHRWKSSVMNTHGCDGCRICAFLDGSRLTTDMLAVINLLDAKLAEKERIIRDLLSVWIREMHETPPND